MKKTKPQKKIIKSYQEFDLISENDNIFYIKSNQKDEFIDYANVHDIFIQTGLKTPDAPFLGTIVDNKEEFISYKEAFYLIERISKLIDIKGENDKIGIFIPNQKEWLLVEQSILQQNLITVPFLNLISLKNFEHILEETELEILFIKNEKELNLIKQLKDTKKLKKVFYIENIEKELFIENIEFIKLDFQITEKDKKEIEKLEIKNKSKSQLDDIFTICYTSGTTSTPKGAMISHKNVISVVNPSINQKNQFFKFTYKYYSYLPLAHMMERVVIHCIIARGSPINFIRSKLLLSDDLKLVQPSIILAVPRVLEIFKTKIEEKMRKNIFLYIFYYLSFILKKYLNIETIILKKIKENFGNLKQILCGSAYLNPKVKEYMEIILGIEIQEGYGCTEGTASNICMPLNFKAGKNSSGVPFFPNKIKIIDNELFLKGDNIFKGYFKNEKETKKIIKNGWLKTSDLIEIRTKENFNIKIIGRKKSSFKTSYGEFIVPEKIENIFCNLMTSKNFDFILIFGSEKKRNLVALILTEKDTRKELIKMDFEKAKEKILENKLLNKIEIPKEVLIKKINLNEKGLLTPTAKIKRNLVKKFFEKEINSLLEQND